MKEWIRKKLLGDNSATADQKRKSKIDQAIDEATGDAPPKTPPKAYKKGGMVRRGYGKARGA